MDAPIRCNIPQYFTQSQNLGSRLNFMPVFGDTVTGYNFESFSPFLIVGVWTRGGGVPNGVPGSLHYSWRGTNIEAGFPYEEIMQSMFAANMNGANQTGDMTYAPNASGLDFSRYFKRSMQEGLMIPNLNRMLLGAFIPRTFWEDYLAFEPLPSFDAMRTNRFTEMTKKLFDETDLKLWMPPGKYIMAGNPPNADPYFGGFDSTFGGGSIGDDGLITLELKSIE
jgi:hypothetical protein